MTFPTALWLGEISAGGCGSIFRRNSWDLTERDFEDPKFGRLGCLGLTSVALPFRERDGLLYISRNRAANISRSRDARVGREA